MDIRMPQKVWRLVAEDLREFSPRTASKIKDKLYAEIDDATDRQVLVVLLDHDGVSAVVDALSGLLLEAQQS